MRKRRRTRPILATIAAVIAVGSVAAGLGFSDLKPAPAPTGPSIDGHGAPTGLDEIPATLLGTVRPYDRAEFGPAWQGIDRNGCDQRNDMLRAAMYDIVAKPGTRGCVVQSGTLDDPYTGRTIHFTRGQTSSLAVQIDHVVPLAWAWKQGAADWTPAQRLAFANDPENLQAVSEHANREKSASGPAEWMPDNAAYQCTYARRFVTVVGTNGLTIGQADRDALARILAGC